MFFAFLLMWTQAGAETKSCLGKTPTGFRHLKSENGIEHYVADKKDMTLSIKCFDKSVRLQDVKSKLERTLSPNTLQKNVEYFDFHGEQVLTRTYLVEEADKLTQLTFVTEIRFVNSLLGLNELIKDWLKR